MITLYVLLMLVFLTGLALSIHYTVEYEKPVLLVFAAPLLLLAAWLYHLFITLQ